MLTILGLDEAGRGSCIGPLVMYGVVIRPDQSDYLISQKIADSKKYSSREARETAASKIKHLCSYAYRTASPSEIDKYVDKKGLNVLERKMAEEIIHEVISGLEIPIAQVVLDGYDMFNPLTEKLAAVHKWTIFHAQDKAESKSLAVAAASVCAKAHRDKLTKAIMGDYFEEGAGYPNLGTEQWIRDLFDIGCLETNVEGNLIHASSMGCYVRQSWSWWKKLKKQLKEEGVL